MKKYTLYSLFIIGLVIVLFFTSCDTPAGNGTHNDNGETTLVCLGDSLTSGYGAVTPGVDDKTKSYPAYLQNKVKLPVVNAGVSGNTSAQGLARVEKDVLSKNPHIVIILLGANDFLNIFNPVPVLQTKSNLQNIINKIDNGSRKIYLAKFYSYASAMDLGVSFGMDEAEIQGVINDYDSMFEALGSLNNVTIIDDIWIGVWGLHMSDVVHPNAAGYEIMAENIFNVMRPYLEENGYIK